MGMGHDDEREPNGDTPLWFRLTIRYGLWAAVAVGLLWVLVGDVRGDVKAMRQEQASSFQILNMWMQRNEFYLRAMCLNAAQSEQQRASCVPPSDVR